MKSKIYHMKAILVMGVYFFNSYVIRNPQNEDCREKTNQELSIFLDFMKDIQKEITNFNSFIKPINCVARMLKLITTSYDKYANTNPVVKEDDLRKYVGDSESHLKTIEKMLLGFFQNFENKHELKKKNPLLYSEIKIIFKSHIQKEKAKELILDRELFIKSVLNEGFHEIIKLVLVIGKIIVFCELIKFLSNIKEKIGVKDFDKIFLITLGEIAICSENEYILRSRKYVLNYAAFGGISAIATTPFQTKISDFKLIGVFTISNLLYGLRDFIGLFNCNNCFEDIMADFCKTLKKTLWQSSSSS